MLKQKKNGNKEPSEAEKQYVAHLQRSLAASSTPGSFQAAYTAHKKSAIKNPYYTQPAWKRWDADPSPVTLTLNHNALTYAPATAENRFYPIFPDNSASAPVFKKMATPTNAFAGCWDDVFISLDKGHSNLHGQKHQFIVGPRLPISFPAVIRLMLGANFTSQSYARRGRHIVDDQVNSMELEHHFYFANCIRATPSHTSFRDNAADKAHDDYDALFGHAYQSVGQSSSEIHALRKMLLAGACMPRDIKYQLKDHGAYAIALLTLFKAALPFSNAQGRPLPYEHEMRHRPAYSSDGHVGHPHWCTHNTHFHGYNDALHQRIMGDMARAMTNPPPVTILRCLNLSVDHDGRRIVDRVTRDPRIKCATLTQARVWGQPGETLTVHLNLSNSYDLNDQPLTYTCHALYPNQSNVTVHELESGKFNVVVRHDPDLPKGRIPVICLARNNGAIPGNPVFLNFYWPQVNERPDFFHFNERDLPEDVKTQIARLNWQSYPVNNNLRPMPGPGFPRHPLQCKPGDTVSFSLAAEDPDGFPVTVYRRTGEPGQIQDNRFSMQIPEDHAEAVEKLHLVFSDGTGGFTGREVKLLITKATNSLPENWHLTTIGTPPSIASINFDHDQCRMSGRTAQSQQRGLNGTWVYREVEGNTDIFCALTDAEQETTADIGIMIRAGLDDHWRYAALLRKANRISATCRVSESRWGTALTSPDSSLATPPHYLRLVKQDDWISLYLSGDAKSWECLQTSRIPMPACYEGILHTSGTNGICRWLTPQDTLPSVRINAKPGKKNRYTVPLEIQLTAGEPGAILRYTLDGTKPTEHARKYVNPITLEKTGRHLVKIRQMINNRAGATVTAIIHTEKPQPKKKNH